MNLSNPDIWQDEERERPGCMNDLVATIERLPPAYVDALFTCRLYGLGTDFFGGFITLVPATFGRIILEARADS